MDKKRSIIGVFDSGLGGLSIQRELIRQLPGESFNYYADSGFCPYGSKPVQEVIDRSVLITEKLISEGADIVVVACNSATAAAIEHLRANYDIPFVGIEPAIKQAAIHTQSGKVGVLATENTFNGKLFKETSAKYAADKNVFIQVGHGLVEIVENGAMREPESVNLIRSYIEPMVKEGVDQIVLGCTHYPFLIDVIKEMVPENLVIHDPAPAVARQTVRLLSEIPGRIIDQSPKYNYFTSGSKDKLEKMLKDINLPISSTGIF